MLKNFTLLFLLALCTNLLGQEDGIQTVNNFGVEDLIKEVFIKGNCRNVSNINAIGSEELSIGQFTNGSNILSLSDGIILSTGTIDLAQGPNEDNGTSFSFGAISEDLDLNELATDELFDVTGIEFDFVPIGNRVSFRYVFASEEYCEFVGTDFNDVFGFFVSGPGINGIFDNNAINVATLIGTDEDVSINTVNHLENTDLYVSNVTTIDAENCDVAYSPIYQDLIEYDGFTIPLTASFAVVPCETYHIRLVIGDVGDANLDSAVFLQSNSFDLGADVNIRVEIPGNDEPIAYESCVDGQFIFTRSDLNNTNGDLTVDYTISSDSEATNGVDFLEIPLSVTIPDGDTSVVLPITIIEDNIIEGPEKLKLKLTYECDCIDPVLSEMIIDEADDFSVNFAELKVCANQSFSISPEIIGGVPPYDFLWETGSISDTLESSITESTQYAVTVSDFCGKSIVGIADIELQNTPTASLTGIYDFCEITTTGIPIILEGNPPWTIGYNIDNIEQIPIENIQTSPFFLNIQTDGTYQFSTFNDANCEGNIIGTAVVESSFDIRVDLVSPSCLNSYDGSIEITQLDAIPPFSIEWNIETENDYFIDKLNEGTYILNIIDGDSCQYEKVIDLNASSFDINECAPIYIPNSFSPNSDGFNDIFSVYFDAAGEIERVVSFQIYNRWGALIYEQNNFIPDNENFGWNGEYKEKPLDPGVYIYKVVLAFTDGRTILKSGDVTLLR